MRSSGYRDTAHAIAELIDNSIQAGLKINSRTEVEVLCVDRMEFVSERQRRRINRIAVYDNACGMDAATLRMALQFGNGTHIDPAEQTGIGKFGMGLPNASISQCQRVDVWSWQGEQCLHTYLDVDEIQKGRLQEVPKPEPSSVPGDWQRLIRDKIGPHGTLVVWTNLDRVTWKGSQAFLDNAEFLVGRIYRYFINDGRARIRLAALEEGAGLPCLDRDARANDPLYLMETTSAPTPWDTKPAFDQDGEPFPMQVSYQGTEHTVTLRFSMAKPEVRESGGQSVIGKHAAKNIGISLVRANRELEMNHTFDIGYDPRERWWGAEVSFEPALDDLFGVTNNKQAATAFLQMDIDEDAKIEGMTSGQYAESLENNNDPRLFMYKISVHIRERLGTLRAQVKRQAAGTKKGEEPIAAPGSVEEVATRALQRRRAQLGDQGISDQQERIPKAEREKEIVNELVSEGTPEEKAKEIAVEYVRSNIKFLFEEAQISGPTIFDVKSKAGTIIIKINMSHPASTHLFELLEEGNSEKDSAALKALKLLLTAWARLEDEANNERRQQLEDTRYDWGRLARDFLQEANG